MPNCTTPTWALIDLENSTFENQTGVVSSQNQSQSVRDQETEEHMVEKYSKSDDLFSLGCILFNHSDVDNSEISEPKPKTRTKPKTPLDDFGLKLMEREFANASEALRFLEELQMEKEEEDGDEEEEDDDGEDDEDDEDDGEEEDDDGEDEEEEEEEEDEDDDEGKEELSLSKKPRKE